MVMPSTPNPVPRKKNAPEIIDLSPLFAGVKKVERDERQGQDSIHGLTIEGAPASSGVVSGELSSPWRRFGAVIAVIFLLLIASVVCWRSDVPFRMVCHYMEVSQPPGKADAIVVLGGEYRGFRLAKASELYTAGYTPKVLLTGFAHASSTAKKFCDRNGIPEAAVLIEPNAKSTRENATLSAPILRGVGARKILLVTSWYHSRRARNDFRRALPEGHFISVSVSRRLEPVSREMVYSEFWKTVCSSLACWIPDKIQIRKP